jgi:hypothetical protein
LYDFAALEAELAREKELEQQSLEIFWRDVLLVLRNAPANSHLHDIARLAYTVPQHYVPPVIEDAEQKVNFKIIFITILEIFHEFYCSLSIFSVINYFYNVSFI